MTDQTPPVDEMQYERLAHEALRGVIREDLQVEADRFSVKLRFGGVPRTLAMPYTAVTRFYDPSVQFLLQFEEPEIVENVEDATPPEDPAPTSDGPKVVSLDQFRKK